MRTTALLQLATLALALLAAPAVVEALELPSGSTLALRLAAVAASLQVLGLLGLLLLYYLDLQREALVAAAVQLGMIALATTIALGAGAPAALGAAVGSIAPAIVSLSLVWRAVGTLVPDTFQSQPYVR